MHTKDAMKKTLLIQKSQIKIADSVFEHVFGCCYIHTIARFRRGVIVSLVCQVLQLMPNGRVHAYYLLQS